MEIFLNAFGKNIPFGRMDILYVQLEMSVKKFQRNISKTKGKCKIMVDYYVAMSYNISIFRKAVCLWINYIGIPAATLQDWEHERRTPPPTIYHWYDGTDFRTGKRTFRERISYGSESI